MAPGETGVEAIEVSGKLGVEQGVGALNCCHYGISAGKLV